MNMFTFRAHTLAVVPWLVALLIIQAVPAYARVSSTLPQTSSRLGDMLNPDGTLNLPAGFSGNLDPAGFRLASTTAGAPRFVPTPQAEEADDAQWDSVFGAPGVSEFGSPSKVSAIAVAPDGSVYIGGPFSEAGALRDVNHIARWDGRRWHAMEDGLNAAPDQIAIGNNRVYVVGNALERAGAAVVNGLAQWDGTEWSPVSDGEGPQRVDEWGTEDATILAVATSGNDLYIGGTFNRIDGITANGIARWNGTRWSALGQGVRIVNFSEELEAKGEVNTIAVDAGKIYVGGDFDVAGTADAKNIAVWNGTTWSGMGSGLDDGQFFSEARVTAIAVSGNNVYAGGLFTKAGAKSVSNVARWDGTTWNALGSGIPGGNFSFEVPVNALVVDGTTLYVGGTFDSAGGRIMGAIAAWDGTRWTQLGSGIPNEQGFAEVYALARGAQGVYVGGNFQFAGGKRLDGVALWDRAEWTPLGQGVLEGDFGDQPGEIYAMAIAEDGSVFIGGRIARAGVVAVSNIAMWNGTRWQPLGTGVDDTVRALAVVGNDIYAGGSFTKAGTSSVQHIARWNRESQRWFALGTGTNGDVHALAWSDGLLYVGGAFKNAGGVTADDLAYWDSARWHAFGTNYRIYERTDQGGEASTWVNALAVQENIVIIGGHFQTIHKQGTSTQPLDNYRLVNNVVGWNRAADSWFVIGPWTAAEEPGVTTNGFSGFNVDVNALAIIGADVYIGGNFNQAGSIVATNIVRWNATTNRWFALDSGVTGIDSALRPPTVRSLYAAGNNLFVAGRFLSAGPIEARFVAHWDVAAGEWNALGSGLRWYNDQFTSAYSVAATPDSVYVGGDFYLAGEKPASGLARWVAPVETGNLTPARGVSLTVPAGTTLNIPAGAVTTNAQVRLTTPFAPARPLPTNRISVHSIRLDASTTAGQPLRQFNSLYTLRVPYSDAALEALNISEASLEFVVFNGTAWVPALPCDGCRIDPQNNVVTIRSNRVAEYALIGTPGASSDNQHKVFLPLTRR